MTPEIFRIALGVSALIIGLSIFIANLFFYRRITQLKNKLGHRFFSQLWTGEISRAGEIFERVLGVFLGLFFVVWATLILLNAATDFN